MKSPFYVSLTPFFDFTQAAKPVVWSSVFANNNPLEVEIGFGNGEYLAAMAQANPTTNYVGFEEYCERIQRTLRKLSRNTSCDNVRVLRMDVRPGFIYLFQERSVRFIHCLFPPPWPKKSDIKHRLFTTEFLTLANSRLIDGGVFKIVTDHKPLADWILDQIPNTGFVHDDTVIGATHGTKFEKKWVEGGQRQFYQIMLSKKEHKSVGAYKEQAMRHYTLEQFDPDSFAMAEYSQDGIAVSFKDYLYDPKRQTALVYVLVNETHLLQNIRIKIFKQGAIWRLSLAEGTLTMPTAGVSQALECVYQAAQSKFTSHS